MSKNRITLNIQQLIGRVEIVVSPSGKDIDMNQVREAVAGAVNKAVRKAGQALDERTMDPHKEDALERVQRCARAYRAAVEDLIATSPTLSGSDLDTGEDSYKWLRLPIADEQPLTVANMILSDVEVFPNDCLAGILVAIWRSQGAMCGRLGSISLDKVGTRIHFCIEGATTLEELRSACARFRASLDLEGEK